MATDEAPSEMSLRLAATNNPTAISGPAVISVAAGGKGKGEPFDPIKVNGPIFEGWPEKPRVAIVITGRQDGYMEPCGCAGLDRMKGGMSRRHTLFKQLREKGWPVLAVDVGGVAKGFGLQAEFKFHRMIDGMRSMGYDAIAMGKSDLTLPAEELASVAASTPNFPSPFVSANTALFGFDAELTARTRVVERGGIRFGITSVLGKKYQQQVRNDEVEMMDPTVALRQKQLVSELREGKVDYPILLAHATIEESVALAEQFPFFRLVVTAGGPPEPPDRPRVLNKGKTLLIEVGQKGMDAIVIALHEEGTKRQLLYERVPLDSRFPGSEEMQVLMQTYQSQLKEAGFAGLGLRPVPHPQKKTHGKYVGSKKCGECHEDSYLIWKQSGHAKAFRTLTDMDPPRQFDPQCVSCHTMGWHTTSFFPYDTGYQSAEATPKLINVGCESCHGPGEMHVKAENGSDMDLQTQAQKLMVVTREESEARACYECHDLDNSPAFDFKTYWPKIEHAEED